MEQYRILIVDDDEQVCKILTDLFQQESHLTVTAHNGAQALERIAEEEPDLVISDIQMPVMDGFELFRILQKEYPHIKHIMMTSYDIDQYINNIQRHNIGNVLPKGVDFNLHEVAAYVRSILTGQIFGMGRYFNGITFNKVAVRSYSQAKEAYKFIIGSFPKDKGLFLEIALDELISNAIFHGALELSEIPREEWNEEMEIPAESAVEVKWGADDEKIGISIEDPKGILKKTDVLRWLDSYREREADNEHGRGFLLVRRLIDRLIINIDPGKRTECIIIQYYKNSRKTYNKPLLIHEI